MPDDVFEPDPDFEPDVESAFEPDTVPNAPISATTTTPQATAPVTPPVAPVVEVDGVSQASPAPNDKTGFLNPYLQAPDANQPNQSVGEATPKPDIPTLRQGDPNATENIRDSMAIKKYLNDTDTLKDYANKGMAAATAATSGLAPYLAGAAQKGWNAYDLAGHLKDVVFSGAPMDVKLHEWNQFAQQASEDEVVATNIGGLAQAVLPFQKLKLVGNIGIGAASAALSTYLGSEMQASGTDMLKATALGGAMGGGGYLGFGQLGQAGKYVLGNKRNFTPDVKGDWKRGAVNGKLKLGLSTNQQIERFTKPTYIKPVVMDSKAVIDLTDSLDKVTQFESEVSLQDHLGNIEGLPRQSLEAAHTIGKPDDLNLISPGPFKMAPEKLSAGSVINPAVKGDPGLPAVLAQIAKDPSKVPSYMVTDLKSMKPVGTGVSIKLVGKKTYQATMVEVSGKGVGIYKKTFKSLNGAIKFKKELNKAGLDAPLHVSDEAMLAMDDLTYRSLMSSEPKAKPKQGAVATYVKSGGTRNERPPGYTPVEAELPPGGKPIGPSMASVSPDGFLQVHNLQTEAAQAQSLLGRNIVAIITPKGPRYARYIMDADEGFVGLAPFDPEEGIPSIRQISRVPVGQVRRVGDSELTDIISEAARQRAAVKFIPESGTRNRLEGPAASDSPYDKQNLYHQDDWNAELTRYGSEPDSMGATNTSYGLFYGHEGGFKNWDGGKKPFKTGKITGENTLDVGQFDWPGIEALRMLDPKLHRKLLSPPYAYKSSGMVRDDVGVSMDTHSTFTPEDAKMVGELVKLLNEQKKLKISKLDYNAPDYWDQKAYIEKQVDDAILAAKEKYGDPTAKKKPLDGPDIPSDWQSYNLDFDKLKEYVSKTYPKLDISHHTLPETMLEIVGAELARAKGYDSIKGYRQYVALKSSAVDYLRMHKARRNDPNANAPDVHVQGGDFDFGPRLSAQGEGTKTFNPNIYTDKTVAGQPWAGKKPSAPPPAPPPPPAMEPMPPPDPPHPPPPFDEPAAQTQKTLMQKLGSMYQKVRRELVFEGLRADFDLSQLINDKKSIHNLQNHQVTIQRALERGLGKKITKFREDVYEWANARLPDEHFENHPDPAFRKAWVQKRQMLLDFQRMRDAQHQRIIELGGIPDNTFSQEEGDLLLKRYVTRTYALHTLPPGKRLEIMMNDRKGIQRAVDGYMQWAKDNMQTLSEADARHKVIEALASEDPASILFGADGPPSPMPGDNLRYRKNLPEWYRDMLGENKDGFYAIARTDAVQKSIIANLEVWDAISKNPEWARTTLDGLPPEVADQWKTLPENKRWYGRASGMKVAPEVYDSLVTLSNATYEANKVATAIIKVQKANWFSLGRMRTYVSTMLDNFAYGMLSGGVDPLTRPYATGRGMGYATRGMLEYRKNPLADNEFAGFVRDARRIGVDEPGHIGSDSSLIARRQELHFYEKMAKEDNVNYATWATKAAEAHAAITKPGSWVFETSDRLHRLASWKMITDDLLAKSSTALQAAEKGMTTKEMAMRLAARQIFRYYPMYGRAAPAANFLSKSSAGLASPTAMFKMERNRVWGSIPFRMFDDPKVMFRLLKMGVVFKGLLGANDAMRNALGEVSDEEVAAAYQERGMSQKMFMPGMLILPMKVGNQIQPLDYTSVAGPLQYLQGDPRLGDVAKTLLNAGYGPFEGGMAGVAIGSMMDSAGIKTSLDSRPPPPGTNPLINVGQQVINRGGIPAIIPEVYNNFANTGAFGSLNRKQEQWPMSAAIARTMGAPLTTPSSTGQDINPSFQSAIGDDLGRIKEAERYLVMAAQMKPDQKVGMLQWVVDNLQGVPPGARRDAIMKAAIDGIREASINLSRTGRLEEAARNSQPKVIRSDDNSGLPVKVIKQ